MQPPAFSRLPGMIAVLFFVMAAGWLLLRNLISYPPLPAPTLASHLDSGSVVRMDSPLFEYSPGWTVSPAGADPHEPADPWQEPSGRLSFVYQGETLALQLAVGNYWGYLYVMVDGEPANRLPQIWGNRASTGTPAGYKPLLAPEVQTPSGPTPKWIVVHEAEEAGSHQVEVEIWRSWGQTPIRAVAVDALPAPPLPLWPAVAMLVLGGWALALALWPRLRTAGNILTANVPPLPLFLPRWLLLPLTVTGIGLVGGGVLAQHWIITDAGLLLLALAGLHRPVLWVGALLFALPFYLYPLPILPGRALNLIEIGVWGGVVLAGMHKLWTSNPTRHSPSIIRNSQFAVRNSPHLWLAAILTLALITAFAADQRAVALREWRVIFLAAGGFVLLLHAALTLDRQQDGLRTLIVFWLAGGTVIALIGIVQYLTGQMLIEAEGVNRVRGLYGSPNNLALYLERTVAVGLALTLFGSTDRQPQTAQFAVRSSQFAIRNSPSAIRRSPLFLMTGLQFVALLLTFSKGALVLALPTILLVLAIGGYILLRQRGASLRPLWGVALVAVASVAGLLPFWGAERFQSLDDFSAESTGGVRINLWRSSVRMALDHPWLGVGPDNFLYTYRSGYILPAAWQDPDLNHPHNVLLDWWTRLGLGGVLLAVGWLASGVRCLWCGVVTDREGALRLGLLAAIAGALAHGLIDASYALPDLMLVWVLLLSLGIKTSPSDAISSPD